MTDTLKYHPSIQLSNIMADNRFPVAGPSGYGLVLARHEEEIKALREIIVKLEARIAVIEDKPAVPLTEN